MDTDFDVVDILVADVSQGQLTVAVGSATDGSAWTLNCPILGIDGFYSVPIDYDDSGAAQAFTYNDGNTELVLGYWDNRYLDRVGSLEPGDRAITTRGNARLVLKDATDSVNILTKAADLPGNDPDMGLSVVGDNGGNSSISLNLGTSIVQITKDEILLMAGGTQLVINAKGVSINGDNFMCNTGGGNLGCIAPATPPIPGANAVLYGPLGQAGVASLSWTIKP